MNGLAAFCQRHELTVREVADLFPRPKGRTGGVSYPTVHRLLHGKVKNDYVEKIEPMIVTGLRSFLIAKGYDRDKAAAEIPDKNFLARQQTFTREITVPKDCFANYVFKDPDGKILTVVVFNQT